MPLYQKFLWGLVAGIALICVKFVGPDQDYVKALPNAGSGEVIFYTLLSAVTIFLGGLSGLFCKDGEPARILVFCASFPALLSAYASQERIDPTLNKQGPVGRADANADPLPGFSLVTRAYAQDGGSEGVCVEGSLISQVGKAAQDYFSPDKSAQSYSVVVASSTALPAAKAKADQFASLAQGTSVYVGCRKPGNPYFPVIVGPNSNQQEAAILLGKIIGEGWAPRDSYISAYEYRKPIYTPN